MTSSYRGLYAHKLDSGEITHVQVEDTGGVGMPLPIEAYRERDVKPPAETLPDQHEYALLHP